VNQSAPLGRDLIERARAVDILPVAQRYGAKLKRIGTEYVGPCPVCGGTDRFAINVIKQVFNCRGCAAAGDVIKLVEHITGGTFVDAIEKLTGETTEQEVDNVNLHKRAPQQPSTNNNAALAGRIWPASVSIAGTVAEHYLARIRGIDLAQIPELDEVLRFHPACPFDKGETACLIALVRDVVTDAPKAIMRTALTDDGRKLARMGLGPKAGGAIKLWPDAAVSTGLVVGEGLETVASAATRIEHKGTLLQPAWALVDAANLAAFPVLSGIEALTLLVDNDESGTGQDAADACTKRWLAADCSVDQLIPHVIGADFNDLLDIGDLP
jgi:phage/plasmid primase-like uncharacterized protein